MFESQLTLPIILSAALLDSINPCVIGVLIFLLAFLVGVYKDPKKMLFAGLVYTLAVYLTYFALGFGILIFAVGTGATRVVYWVAAVIAIVAGLLEIKDFFWYGKGFTLQMIPGASKRVKAYTNRIKTLNQRSPWLSYGMAFLLGIFVPLVELPCTGAPYIAILALIAEGSYGSALPYLLLYNLVFVAPLLVIIGMVYFGKSSEGIEKWRMRHRHLMRLLAGIFLLALGGYMIYSIV
ncbi:cytochrome c biogenesis CcdA family protein [Patescibacteria group bacterium]